MPSDDQDLLARPHPPHVFGGRGRDPERRTVHHRVVMVDDGLVAVEIPVVKGADIVVVAGDVTVQRGDSMHIGEGHASTLPLIWLVS